MVGLRPLAGSIALAGCSSACDISHSSSVADGEPGTDAVYVFFTAAIAARGAARRVVT